MKEAFRDVIQFHRACGLPVTGHWRSSEHNPIFNVGSWTTNERTGKFEPPIITPNPDGRLEMRMGLIYEETKEIEKAIEDGDIEAFADGLADLIYVTLGLAIEAGIDLPIVWKEVQKANMKKASGPKREDGKQLKPEGWEPPDIGYVLWAKCKNIDEEY